MTQRSQEGQDERARLDLPPHSVEAEEVFLGAVLMNPEVLPEVVTEVQEESFFIVRHGWVWAAIVHLYERQEAIDTFTVGEVLRTQHDPTGKHTNRLEAVGGAAFLNWLPGNVPTALHAPVYGQIVERAAIRRRLLGVAGEISRLAYDEDRDTRSVMQEAQRLLLSVTGRSFDPTTVSITQAVDEFYTHMDALRQAVQEGRLLGIPTGYRDLDNLTGGLQKSDLFLVAGRPGSGKTALLVNLALNAAIVGRRVALFSGEMARDQILLRMVGVHAGLNIKRLRTGELTDEEWGRFVAACGILAELPIILDDKARMSPEYIRATSQRLRDTDGLDLVMIDYLGTSILDTSAAGGSTVERMTYLSGEAKNLAKELNIPVLAAAQLSRAVEQRQDKRPQQSDLRESGALEQDADVIALLYRDEMYNPATERPGEIDVIIAKHRNGPTGVVPLFFEREATRLRSVVRVSFSFNQDSDGWLSLERPGEDD